VRRIDVLASGQSGTQVRGRHARRRHRHQNIPVDEILGQAAHHGVEISGLGYYPNPLDPDPEIAKRCTDHLKKVILGAEKIGLNRVNSFIGRDWTRSVDDNWPRFLKPGNRSSHSRKTMASGSALRIVRCSSRTTNAQRQESRDQSRDLAPDVFRINSDHFGLNYDPSHMVWQQMDWLKPLHEFKRKLFHVHAKDVLILRDRLNDVGIYGYPKETHLPRIPGFGESTGHSLLAS
jgi:sugar phosphate isomerase/epimerase